MRPQLRENDQQRKKHSLNLTEEQSAIIKSAGNIKINAVAGSGKTTTVIQYAASRPKGSTILYLAFNRSVKLEAKKRFAQLGLHHVQVETAHSLAFNHIVAKSEYKISASGYTPFEVAKILRLLGNGERHGEFVLANHILKFMAYFCNSNAEKVQDLDYRHTITDKQVLTFVTNFYTQIEKGTRRLLGKMHKGEIDITHDFYLKMFQLSKPRLSFNYILFDEGQDASPAMLDVFLNQASTKVIVGDAHQQIYGWRHAVNSLAKVDYPAYELSTSFRFSQEIANIAMDVLEWKKHLQQFDKVRISGKGNFTEIKSKATIARSNLGLLLSAITFITENEKVRSLYFEGNINSYTYADDGASLYDVLNLHDRKRGLIRDKLIASMHSLKELEEYINKTEDKQLSMMVEIVKEYGNEIPGLIQSLKSMHVADDEKEKAEMIFSTVHRAKGMEYDEVTLADDFVTESELKRLGAEIRNDNTSLAKWNEEINLIYVAFTRARRKLNVPEKLLPDHFINSSFIEKINTEGPPAAMPNNETPKPSKPPKRAAKKQLQNGETAYSYIEKRLQHKNAYERWTPEKDAELKEMYNKGIKVKGLTEYFGRNEGAIKSRLKRIGCLSFN